MRRYEKKKMADLAYNKHLSVAKRPKRKLLKHKEHHTNPDAYLSKSVNGILDGPVNNTVARQPDG